MKQKTFPSARKSACEGHKKTFQGVPLGLQNSQICHTQQQRILARNQHGIKNTHLGMIFSYIFLQICCSAFTQSREFFLPQVAGITDIKGFANGKQKHTTPHTAIAFYFPLAKSIICIAVLYINDSNKILGCGDLKNKILVFTLFFPEQLIILAKCYSGQVLSTSATKL